MMDHKIIEGVKCYAPDLATQNGDFSIGDFEMLYKAENINFWFTSRNKIIHNLFRKFLKEDKVYNVLEVGCGTGFVLSGLSKNKNYKLSGAEIYLEGLKYAKLRLPDVDFFQLDATRMPFIEEYDAIGAFDVLEHIQEDELVMSNVFSALKKGGYFFISVPQYKSMWSYLDDAAFHKRRYERKELVSKITKAGFKVEYVSSFVFTLFPAMYLSRLLKKNKMTKAKLRKEEMYHELFLPSFVNSIFKMFMKLDEVLIKAGISLPFGGSLILVAVK